MTRRERTAQLPLPGDDLARVRERSEQPLRRLDGANVLITGASGLVGSWMLETLLDAQHVFAMDVTATALVRNVTAFTDRYPHLAASPHLTIHEGDVRRFRIAGRQPTHVIHAASADSPERNASAPDDVIDVIESGTEHVLGATASASRCLIVSSGSVYVPQVRPITEDDPTVDAGVSAAERFGAAKRRAERCAERATASRGVTIARVFTLVGPRLPLAGQFAIGQFLDDAISGRAVRVRGDGTPLRSYLYLADLAVWCWHLLDRGGEPRIYNVGASEALSVEVVARQVAALGGVNVSIDAVPVPGARAACYLPSVERARRELGLEAWTSLDDGLARSWAWLESSAA